jgi:VCBS repeat-containing protein
MNNNTRTRIVFNPGQIKGASNLPLSTNWYGSKPVITFSFNLQGNVPSVAYDSGALPDYFGVGTTAADVQALSPLLQQAVRNAARAWELVANVQLQEVNTVAEDPNRNIDAQFGDILISGMSFQNSRNADLTPSDAGVTIQTPRSPDESVDGDIWINTTNVDSQGVASPSTTWSASTQADIANGSFAQWVMLHELGHALGIGHPFNTPWDSNLYSVLSYTDNLPDPRHPAQNVQDPAPFTPMLVDILSIQRLYGANPNANTGANTYVFQSTGGWPVQAIWDAGGTDLIDGSNQGVELQIDLNPGGISFTGNRNEGDNEIHLAFTPQQFETLTPTEQASGVRDDPAWVAGGQYANHHLIENANGGSRADLIYGNQVANVLRGNGGDDDIEGGDGNDTIEGGKDNDDLFGGAGTDVYVYSTGDGKDTIKDSDHQGNVQINGAVLSGTFTLVTDKEVPAEYRKKEYRLPGQSIWHAMVGGQDVYLYADLSQLHTGTTLTIAGPALGAHGSIRIEDFVSDFQSRNDFGISLDPTPKTALNLPTDFWQERSALQAGLELSGPASAGQFVRVSIDPSVSGAARWVTGAQTLSFRSDGTLEFELEAGQDIFNYSLLSVGDVDQDSQVTLTVTLLDANGDPIDGSSSSMVINFNAIDEEDVGAPEITNIIEGDREPQLDQDDNPILDSWGNIVPAGVEVGRDDVLNDTPANDLILGLDGNDILGNTGRGGDDVLDSGAGDDHLNAGPGNDHLIGGAGVDVGRGNSGNDLIELNGDQDFGYGHDGNDRLFGEDVVDVETAIANGVSAETVLGRGDWLQGVGGTDLIVGSNRQDILGGGADADLIIAGGGDDYVAGDLVLSANQIDWTFAVSVSNHVYTPVVTGASIQDFGGVGGDDTVHAGGGNDYVSGGMGNDLIFGDDGNDIVFGEAGNDTLLGGEGDDLLDGGDPDEDIAGRDFLDGGAGNDRLSGADGDDTIFGGVGNDELNGDDGNEHDGADYLNGEDGDDQIIGGGRNDLLYGGAGNDQMFGEGGGIDAEMHGDDHLDGGTGDDTLVGGGGRDILIGGEGNDTLGGEASSDPEEVHADDYLDGGAGNDLLIGEGGADMMFGGEGDDQMFGESSATPENVQGADYMEGGAGNDVMSGGGGADTMFGGAENDQMYGETVDTPESQHAADFMDGGAGDDLLIGEGGADLLFGGAGDDRLFGESSSTPESVWGDDLLDGGDGNDTLSGAGGNDDLQGGAGDDELFGGMGDDALFGGDGEDRLFGNQGDDHLDGGAGRDVYGYSLGSGVDTIADFGGNTLQLSFSFLSSGVSLGLGSLQLTFASSPGDAIHINGFDRLNPYSSVVIDRFEFSDRVMSYEEILALGFDFNGTPGADQIEGTGAADRINALASGDRVIAHAGDDIIDGGDGDDLLLAGAGNDVVLGGSGDDVILGGEDSDSIDGGSGADEMWGNQGDDSFVVESAGDVVVELADEGLDTVQSSITYTLTDNVENLTLTGTQALNGTGNQLSNVITGNDADNTLLGLGGNDSLVGNGGNDRLDGGQGADIMRGGAGDDVYIVDNALDSITENAGEGLDRVESSASHTLGANIDNLLLTGTNAINGTGNDLANEIAGNDAGNVLNGAGGNDTLIGNGGADSLNGGAGNDTLSGGTGNDTLNGGAGTNSLSGGAGDDIYLIDSTGINTIVELANEGTDRVDASITHTLADNVENLTQTGSTAIVGTGNALDNVIRGNSSHNSLYGLAGTDQLFGNAGDDVLDGGEGADRLEGGTGNDTYIVDNTADQVIETTSNDFNDRLQTSVSYTLAASARIEHVVLTGSDAINANGNASVWDYAGNEADNVITDFGSASQYGNGGNDTLIATGDYSNDLDGGEGIDTMQGGDGSDTYVVDNAADVVIENLNEGWDEVQSSVTYTLASNVDALTLIGGAGDIDGTGNEITNEIAGNEGNNVLLGLQGEDRLNGGEGDDTLDGGADNDSLYGDFGNDVILGGAGDDYLYDTEGENVLSGGAGDDLYIVGDRFGEDSSHSVVIEQANEGYDIVHSTVSFTLGDNVETLYIDDPFFGFNPFTFRAGTGNDLANTIYGSNARNTLTGLGGNDSIDGRAGNDEIYGNEGDDVLYGGDDNSFAGGEGSADGYIENDDLIDGGAGNDSIDGGSGDDTLLGDEGDDSLFGGEDDIGFGGGFGGGEGYGYGYGYPLTNNDYLDGGAGDDMLDGGSGNDSLFGGDGVDHLYGGDDGSINYENDDVLDGGAGLDTMEGGSGNDTYHVDGTYIEVPDPDAVDGCGDPIPGATKRSWTTDTIIEGVGEGYDVVYSTASIVLPENFEEVHLVGEDNIDATGSSGDEYLEGNSGNNRLDGGGGDDFLSGLAGDDTYVINDDLDYVDEAADGGNDTIIASFDYDLSVNVENVENLTLAGSAITAIGNDGDNTLIGNAEDNELSGGGGNDTLNGGAGNDLLIGGAGDDTYNFTRGSGVDVIDDIEGLNRVHLLTDSLTEADITITQSGDDLILSINDTTDQLTLRGWNAIPELRTGSIELCDGTVIGTGNPNTAPTPLADSSTAIEDQLQVVTGNVLGNDSDAETASLLSVLNPGTHTNDYGTLVLDADGDYTFTLNNAFVQSMQAGERRSAIAVSYVVSDNDPRGGLTSTATLSIDVLGTNDGPVAVSDANSVSEDAVLVATSNVLANDTDVDTDTVLSVSNPATLAGTYGTLTLGADGQYSYALNNSAAIVQQLRGGQGAQDVFNYVATDGIEQATASLVINVTGANDGPLAVNDVNVASEDGTLTATGNVLANDSDPDAGTVLSVSSPGTLVGTYGTATLAADGSYSYSLNNSSALVQSLGQGETVTDVFSYTARDDDSTPLTATAALTISVAGANDAPILVTPVADQSVQAGQAFTLSLPAGTFTDIDRNDSLTYTATLADGTPLPSWLTFDPATQSFGGTREATSVESYQIRVIATDRFGASASDDFGLTIAPSGSGVILHFTPECTWPAGTSSLGCIDISGKNKSDLVYEGGPGIDTLLGTDSCDAILLDDKLAECDPDTPARLVSIEIIDAGAGDDVVDLTSNRFSYGDVTVHGGSGNDFLVGGAGRNTLRGDDGHDDLFGKGADDVLDGGAGNDCLFGAGGNDTLSGGEGDDHMEGGAGADVMSGGDGNDLYIVESSGDVVVEADCQGWDHVYASISYVLADHVEALTLEGTADLSATGNSLGNSLYGNSGNNVLDGGAGDDSMRGDAGDDVYIVDTIYDSIQENSNRGTDSVLSSVTWTLSSNVENLTLTGADAIDGTGNGLNNVIVGNAGNNVLNGGNGADTLTGGLGDDTFVVNTSGDQVIENAGEGSDTVKSSISYSLGDQLESLTLTGSAAIDGVGNAADNLMTGNNANNRLEGGAGNDTLNGAGGDDTMLGGTGNDAYFVNSAADVVIENAGEGIDVVSSSVGGALAANIEVLFLTGSSALSATDNALDTLLRGNGAANVLTGAAGTDILEGGGGADTLSDTIGNTLFNGGAGSDTMTGGAGNDLYIGGAGSDVINTGSGADVIVFNRGDGKDTVNASTGADNTLSIGNGILYGDLLFKKSGNNLILLTGSNEQLTFVDWYADANNRSVGRLQVVIEGTSEYDAGSADSMHNKKVETFDFSGLVSAFDAARAANPSLSNWALSGALASTLLGGSDTSAIGGDLAYRYARGATLADVSWSPALGILSDASFGSVPQNFQSLSGLQDPTVRLS